MSSPERKASMKKKKKNTYSKITNHGCMKVPRNSKAIHQIEKTSSTLSFQITSLSTVMPSRKANGKLVNSVVCFLEDLENETAQMALHEDSFRRSHHSKAIRSDYGEGVLPTTMVKLNTTVSDGRTFNPLNYQDMLGMWALYRK